MAAPAYRSSAVGTENTGSSIVVTKPSGTAADDIMMAVLYLETGNAVTAPSGWTNHENREFSSPNNFARYYWKRAGGSEPANYTWSWSGNTWRQAAIASYSGAETASDPIDIDGSQANAASTTLTSPSVTTTVTDTRLLFECAGADNLTGRTPPTGFSERYEAVNVYLSDNTQASAGATGTKTMTITNQESVGGMIALKQPQATGTEYWPSLRCISVP